MTEETKSMLDKIMLQKWDIFHERYVFVVNPKTKDKLGLGREYKYCNVFISHKLPEDNIYFIPYRDIPKL